MYTDYQVVTSCSI